MIGNRARTARPLRTCQNYSERDKLWSALQEYSQNRCTSVYRGRFLGTQAEPEIRDGLDVLKVIFMNHTFQPSAGNFGAI